MNEIIFCKKNILKDSGLQGREAKRQRASKRGRGQKGRGEVGRQRGRE